MEKRKPTMEDRINQLGNWAIDLVSQLIGLGLAVVFMVVVGRALITFVEIFPPAPSFDTTALSEWCGEPSGTIRLVGGWYYEPGTLEDEQGNLWGWSGEVEENAFLLLWIDDNGTPEVEDDEIIKVWQEI